MKPLTSELRTECAGLDLWELSELRGSLHHAEQGTLNIIAMSTVKVRHAKTKMHKYS